MNMIAGAKVSIVDPTPGVTRDRVTAIVDLDPEFRGTGDPKTVEFIDTGGFGAYTAPGERYDELGEDLHSLTNSIEFQIGTAIADADLVLFVLDSQMGLTPQDEEIARLLREGKFVRKAREIRESLGGGPGTTPKKKLTKAQEKALAKELASELAKSGKKPAGKGKKPKADPAAATPVPPIRVVANKTDGPRWESHAAEFAGLGFGEPLMVSAKNNYMRRDLLAACYNAVPEAVKAEEPNADLKIAIVGKRNSGKSTLINTLAGEPRVIVSEIAGTTRDAIDVRFELESPSKDGAPPTRRSVLAIDTAGVRRAKSFQNMVEHFAFDRVKRAVDRADVGLLLIDATVKISQVDEQVAMLLQKSYKPTIIVVNKWDLVEGKPNRKGLPITTADYEEYLRKELGGLAWAPIAFISGKNGRNVRKTIELAAELKEQASTRVTTGKLNRIVRKIMETRSPTDTKGTHGKVFYIAQTGTSPPTITLVVNFPGLFKPNYMRFVMNRFREELPFVEVPMRIVVRARRDREDDIPTKTGTSVKTRDGVTLTRGVRGGPVDDAKAALKGPQETRRGKKMHQAPVPHAVAEDTFIDRELTDDELSQFADDAQVYFDD